MALQSVHSRLTFNDSALRQLREREAALLLAEERACVALQAAQDALDTVRSELQDVRGRSADIASTNNDLRASLSARLLRSVPSELLYRIFVDTVSNPRDWKGWMPSGCDPLDPPRDTIPFTLAAVCRRWRREAIRMGRLWSFIVVPPPVGTAVLDYLAVMLERSQAAPLDIIMEWNAVVPSSRRSQQQAFSTDICRGVFDQLGEVAQRLRRVYCRLHSSCDAAPLLRQFLLYPTPQLQELAVEASSLEWRDRDRPDELVDGFMDRCLPHCPQLRKLHTNIAHPLCSDGYSSLTHLVLEYLALSGTAVWEVLRGCRVLVHLDIALIKDYTKGPPAPAPFTVVLPALRTFLLRSFSDTLFGAWIDHLTVPSLQTLEMREVTSLGATSRIMAHVSNTVISLVYCTYETLGRADAEKLSVLENLRRVTVSEPGADFYRYLIENDAWPKLESLCLVFGDTEEEDHRALVDFARTRKESAETATLERVVFADGEQPRWLANNVGLYTSVHAR
ncbi:hypothetical protein AURDEDRAFT_117638 [Auricularia subglabra TFB-10046 SS5]|uniref:F-box domain-containing protein n=1 Tax=Auricularia subglabra (strain TFB-10046 / SS5) TaxID=717982 RepID=J0CVC7_AURST|nr:hypothetical protein AURDEDRAFT_117638 [Auricularia subglabra TFB-10046 SS5]